MVDQSQLNGSYDFKNIDFCCSTFKILHKVEGILYEMVEYFEEKLKPFMISMGSPQL